MFGEISEYHNGDAAWCGAGEHVMGNPPTGARREKLQHDAGILYTGLLIQGHHYDTLKERYGWSKEQVDKMADYMKNHPDWSKDFGII